MYSQLAMQGQDRQPGRSPHLALAFGAALILHAGALALLSSWSIQKSAAPGEQLVAIDLAPQMIEAPTQELIEAATLTGAPPVIPDVVIPGAQLAHAAADAHSNMARYEEVIPRATSVDPLPQLSEAETPLEVTEVSPPIAPDVITTTQTASEASVPVAEAAPEAAAKRPPRKVAGTASEPPTRKRPKKKEVPREEAQKDNRRLQERAAGGDPRPKSGPRDRDQRESTRGQVSRSDSDEAAASNYDPSALSRYSAQLAQALRARLRYPDAARAAGYTGVASVRFTIHRSGRVLSANLVRSSGHPDLDQAAVATVSPGTSLPAAPPALTQQTFTISVPLRFGLR